MNTSVVSMCVLSGSWCSRLLCPRICPSKNTGVGCHFLLQGIFPTRGLDSFFFFFFFRGLDSCLLNLLHWQVVSLAPSHLGSAWTFYRFWQMYMITPPHYNIIQISYCSKHPQCSACPYLSPRKLQATTDLFTVSMIWSYVFP